jgi:hypothetical protein
MNGSRVQSPTANERKHKKKIPEKLKNLKFLTPFRTADQNPASPPQVTGVKLPRSSDCSWLSVEFLKIVSSSP